MSDTAYIPLDDVNVYEHSSYVDTGNKPQYKLDVQAESLAFSDTATKHMLYVLNAGWDANFIDDIKVSEGWEIVDKPNALLKIKPNHMMAIAVQLTAGSTVTSGVLVVESGRSNGNHTVVLTKA